MSKLIESIKQNESNITQMMPEKATLEVLEHYSDIVLLKGMRRMEFILDNDDYVSLSGKEFKVTPADKVKAFNSVVNLGRLIEARQQRAAKEDEGAIDIPDELKK